MSDQAAGTPAPAAAATGAPDSPRVALVHDWLTGMRGGERVLETIADFFPEAPIYTLFHFPGTVSRKLESHPIHTSYLQRAPGLRRHYRKYLPFFPAAIESLDLSPYDLVISVSHCVAKGVLTRPGSFHFCYCNTPMRYAWDQEVVYFPKRTGLVARVRGEILSRLRQWDVASSDRVDRYVGNSSFIAQRIRRYYGREAGVLHPPVDLDFYTPGPAERQDFALMVAALAPYKRVDLAIAACQRAGIELRVVGTGPEWEKLERMAAGSVRFLGRIDAEELRHLYRTASCLLQPGVEDFGMTVVEALACDCPVVALGQGGVLDIVISGQHGVLYGQSDEPDELAAAIDKLREVRSNFMNLRGRAERFSTEVFRSKLETMLVPDSNHGDIAEF